MAAINSPAWMYPNGATPTAAELEELARYEPTLKGRRTDYALFQGTDIVELRTGADPNNNAVNTEVFVAPYDLEIGAIYHGATSAGGSAGTGILQVGANVSGLANAQAAATDVKTTAPTPVKVLPEVGKNVVKAGEVMRATFTGTGAGAMVGCTTRVVVRRL